MDALVHLFISPGFMPHGHCFLWSPVLLWLYVASDSLIALSYYSIPVTLWHFVRRRTDLPFSWVFVMFAVFIFACGTTHLMAIWNIWEPVYWLDAEIKAVTAAASLVTAVLLWPLLPKALSLPSPRQLEQVNQILRAEIATRRRVESELQTLNQELEHRVAARTAEIETANAELRQSQQLLQALLNNTSTIIYVKRLDGRFLLVNRSFENLFQVTQAELRYMTDYDLFTQEQADAFRAVDEQAAVAQAPLEVEEVASLEDGPHTYLSVKFPIRDVNGHAYAVGGISTDITERKLAEHRARSQLARLDLLSRTTRAISERQDLESIFRVVLSSLEDHLLIDLGCVGLCDASGQQMAIAAVGTNSLALAGSLDIAEQCVIEVEQNGLARCVAGHQVYEPDIEQVLFAFPQDLAKGGLKSLVLSPLQIDGTTFGVLICARCQPDGFSSGDCEFLRQLCEQVSLAARQANLHSALQRAYDDLRESQQATMQQERLRVLGQMASGIAHDINNAIVPISLYTELLLDSEPGLSTKARSSLQTMQRAIGDVSRTVARMREFYRQRDPQTPVAAESLNVLAEEVSELTRARWSDMPQQRGVVIEFAKQLAPDLPLVECVAGEVRDALVNLVINAADAMPGGGRLTLRTGLVPPEEQREVPVLLRVFVEISDTGVGMNEETRRRCLEPFFTTKGERGTGLGLAMVYGMAERHSAELDIRSAQGAGTTVRLIFPAASTATLVVKAPSPTMPLPMRLLIIDDDPVVLTTVAGILEGDGHTVVVAGGGREGIDTFAQSLSSDKPFAAVITDLGMPYVDGRQVAKAIKDAAPATPVILLTGWGKRLVEEDDVPPHVDLILSKPPKFRELREALAPLSQPADLPTPKHPLRILVVDDNPVNQVLAQRLLTERGHTVMVANNGRQAVESYQRHDLDLILMDLQMPDVDGFTATSQIRALERSTDRHVRIIALTAHEGDVVGQRMVQAGFDGFLAKPFRKRDLLATAEEDNQPRIADTPATRADCTPPVEAQPHETSGRSAEEPDSITDNGNPQGTS